MQVSLVVAVAENGVIGRQGALPWRLSADLQRFKRLTWGGILILGRRTYESIGKPLPGRTSIVLTRGAWPAQADLLIARSLAEALQLSRTAAQPAQGSGTHRQAFVIGGHTVFGEALPLADRLHWTAVHANVSGDTFFPPMDWSQWQLVHEEAVPADERNEWPTTYRIFDRLRHVPRGT